LIQIIVSFSVFFNISQGSVATHLRGGGIFINNFIENFHLSTSVKELWKSVNIQQRYGQEYRVSLFWLTVYIIFGASTVGTVLNVSQSIAILKQIFTSCL